MKKTTFRSRLPYKRPGTKGSNKGVREYNLIINYFLTLDRLRGATYGQLAKRYRLDNANIYKRIHGTLNAEKVTNNGERPFASNPPAIVNPQR